jgi:homoserine dehydrogenase
MRDIIVLKFGSSVLRSRSDLPAAVHEIYRWYRESHRVIAVVSAIGDTTDWLLGEGQVLQAEPEPYALAELLATGERGAAALLGIALDRAGVPARVVDPREIRLTALGAVLDSEPTALHVARLTDLLAASPVVVLPGFFGHDAGGRLHLLGRGGTDLSAVFIAGAVRACRCRLLKDVGGVYDHDPAATTAGPAHLLSAVGYGTAITDAAQLIQSKAVRFLERYKGTAEVAGLCQPYETQVGDFTDEFQAVKTCPPTTVLLLGLGTVGFGVYRRLRAMPQHFKVIGVLCLDRAKHEASGVPPEILFTPDSRLALLDPDIVVEALPGEMPAHSLLHHFLDCGVNVVSANKRLIAASGPQLHRIAARNGAELHYSAAVGGSTPMIEAIRRNSFAEDIRQISGVLNGTCNFVLDRCATGMSFEEAVVTAQSLGFAESDPSDDLLGHDAARKLRILARYAFRQELDGIDVQPLSATSLAKVRATRRPDQVIRVVARAWRESSGLRGDVRLLALEHDDPLAGIRKEWNALVVTRADGSTNTVVGRGAGRWPTTEAIVADLLKLRFNQIDAAIDSAALGDQSVIATH